MIFSILFHLIFALVLTEICELLVAFLLKYRKREELLAIFGINLITNPILNYGILVNSQLQLISFSIPLLLLLEIIIIIVEAKILIFIMKKPIKEMFFLSFAINFTSFIIGIIIFGF